MVSTPELQVNLDSAPAQTQQASSKQDGEEITANPEHLINVFEIESSSSESDEDSQSADERCEGAPCWLGELIDAVDECEWKRVIKIQTRHKEAATARVTRGEDTPLMVALMSDASLRYIRKLVSLMSREALAVSDFSGNTALHKAAWHGNIKAAKLLIEKNENLPNVFNNINWLPVHVAVRRSHQKMTLYLLSKTSPERMLLEPRDAMILEFSIKTERYDLARYIVEYNARLAFEMEDIPSPLDVLAHSSSSFPSGMKLSSCQSVLYNCVPEKLMVMDSISLVRNHFSTPNTTKKRILRVCEKLYACFWVALELIVFPMKQVRREKAKHFHAMELVELLCEKISSTEEEALFKDPLLHAATNGIYEMVEEIRDWCRSARNFEDEQGRNFFELGVINRHEKTLKVLEDYQEKVHILNRVDSDDNNILHLVGREPRYDDFGSGAVFKMQLELLWFQELASIYPELKTRLNRDRKTPLMIFNEEHSEIAKSELNRLNSMATSCSVAASIIATVAFAAAITVPGGNNSDGLPNFSRRNSFTVFMVSDALAVVSSITTLVSFLSIFTSQYVAHDFVYAIPNRVILGLISLMFSIVFLMVAFGSTVVLVEAARRPFVLLPIVLLGCVPAAVFVLLQVPTLLKMISSTYGPSIFK